MLYIQCRFGKIMTVLKFSSCIVLTSNKAKILFLRFSKYLISYILILNFQFLWSFSSMQLTFIKLFKNEITTSQDFCFKDSVVWVLGSKPLLNDIDNHTVYHTTRQKSKNNSLESISLCRYNFHANNYRSKGIML